MNDPLLMVDFPTRNVVPRWGIGAILGLLGLLGFVLFQRLGSEDRSWTQWEKHELTGVVLGQNPDQNASAKTPASAGNRRASASPVWAQVQETGTAPTQKESAEPGDPFAGAASQRMTASSTSEQTSSPAAAPRRLFQEDQPQAARIQARSAMEHPSLSAQEPGEAGQDPAFHGTTGIDNAGTHPTATPPELDFATKARQKSAPGDLKGSARFQRVQQVAGTEEAESLFPGPAPLGQMPIQSLPPAGSPPANAERASHDEIPAMPHELSLDPLPTQQVQPAPAGTMPEPSAFEPQPTLSSPAAQPIDAQPLLQPNRIPSSPLDVNGSGLPPSAQDFSASPVRQPSIAPQPRAQKPYQEPISPGMSRQMTAQPVTDVKPDEVYKVESGDNYWTISRRYYGSARFFSALAEYNKHRIPAPEKMKPGMYVLVPDVEVLHQRYPQLTGGGPRDPAESAPPGFFVDANGQPCYRVGKGDTLTDIAQTYLGRSSRWVQIQGMNQDRLKDGKTLKIGLVLRLPADASQVVLAPADSSIR